MNIEFKPVGGEIQEFKKEVKRVLSIAVIETFGSSEGDLTSENVVPDNDLDDELDDPNEETYFIEIDHKRVGAVAINVKIKNEGNDGSDASKPLRGSLDLFILFPEYHGKGYGTKIMKAIEERYPNIRVWELITPYFEKRNIHFYVNKCGYKIVEFFNEYHKDPEYSDKEERTRPFEREYFRFEKLL